MSAPLRIFQIGVQLNEKKISREAKFGARSLNTESRTLVAVASTGSRGARGTYDESLDVRGADLTRLNSGRAPLLDSHRQDGIESILGTIQRAWLDGDKLMVEIRFAETPKGEMAMQMVSRGELGSLSIGFKVTKWTDVTTDSDPRPHYRASEFEIFEVSMVATPFDPGATVRSLNRESNSAESAESTSTMSNEVILQAERTRVREIKNLCRNAGLLELEDGLIERGVTVDEARKAVLDEMSKKPAPAAQIDSTARVEVSSRNHDTKRDLLVGALVEQFGGVAAPKDADMFRGRSLLRNLENVVQRRFGETDSTFANRAMSSSDLPYILANVAEKSIANRLALQKPTWSAWAGSGTLRNFKTHDLLKMSSWPSLEERQEGAEFKFGSLSEDREQVAMKEYGVALAFTRRMLVNDDLGEIRAMISQSAIAVNSLENELCYAILTGNPVMADSEQVFSSAHSNLLSAAALTDATIGEAFKKMREQTSIDGRKLNLAPKYLICGPDQEMAARKYLAQIAPSQASNVNPFSGSLELVVDSEITSNDYFFSADKSQDAGVKLFRLEGEESPRVESRNNFANENVEIKVAHSAVAKAVDYRGLCKSANAS